MPSLGIKADAIPGRLNQLNLMFNRPGVFYGQCSEICGANHSFMPISVEAIKLRSTVRDNDLPAIGRNLAEPGRDQVQ